MSVSRRTVTRGAAWSAPTIVVGASAPAFAGSPASCRTTTMSWGSASAPRISNPTILTVTGGSQTVYAAVTYVTNAGATGSTSSYHLGVGRRAYTSISGGTTYTLSTTGGGNDLILNQKAGSGMTSVTVSFFSDAAATKPVYVNNLSVPLDDFSSGTSWDGLFIKTLTPSTSYEEGWAVSGTTSSGTTTPAITGITSPYNSASTVANISGSGSTASPWYFSAQNLTSSSRLAVGGNVITMFAQPISSVTITYSSNPSSWAQSNNLSGAQGAGLGAFSMCV